MPLVAVAPCQCFTPGGIQMTSPGLISCFSRPSCCTQPRPAVTIRVCPSGCLCQAERAPGSNVTYEPDVRDGSCAWNRGSMRTEPVKYAAGPFREGCEPLRVMVMVCASAAAEASRKSHPLEGPCQEAKPLPYTTFDHFFSMIRQKAKSHQGSAVPVLRAREGVVSLSAPGASSCGDASPGADTWEQARLGRAINPLR
jgi:hypothetical protein